jgi:glutamate-1-semialdehyde 2,1-aminomutase
LYDRAVESLVGGVNSPVRAEPEPYPEFIDRGEGAEVVDVDGQSYLDFVMGYGPLLLGHDMPEPVERAVQQAASAGPMFGAPTEVEIELAEFIADHVPSVQLCRFVNSGTEATSAVARLARGYTGRDKIVLVQGGYHGGHESFLVEGDADDPTPSSAGVPQEFADHALPVPFNAPAEASRVFEEHGDEIAAVLIEPVLGNTGIVAPQRNYHQKLRNLCTEHGSLLIFDEVITGFRVGGLGGAQSELGVTPDLTTFAKIMGGGFPIGAIGGRAEIMEHFTPNGDVFESGTFNGHPVSIAAGLATLQFVGNNDV